MTSQQEHPSARARTLNSVLRRTHFKVALIALALAGLSLTLVGLLALRAYSSHNLLLVARSISYTAEAAVVFRDAEAAIESVRLIAEPEEVASVRIIDRQGEELVNWENMQSGLLPKVERLISRILQPSPVIMPIMHDDASVGQLELVGSGKGLLSFLINGLLLLGACLLLSAVGASRLSRSVIQGIAQPLRNLAKVAHSVRYHGTFDHRVPPADIVELNELGKDFNDLLDEVEAWRAHLHEENAVLSHRASHDSLTGLANREFLRTRLNREIRGADEQGQRLALMYMDCDRFKYINDTFGHGAGDDVLKTLATRLHGQLRKNDLLARMGGDEFAAVISPYYQIEDLHEIACNIQEAAAIPIKLTNGHIVAVSLSIGIAVFPDDAQTMDGLLEVADAMMYRAKRSSSDERRAAHFANMDAITE